MLVLNEILGPKCKCCVHEVNITGSHKTCLCVDNAVTVMIMAADSPGMDTVAESYEAFTVKGG